jgi:hypothetical protein
MITLPSVLQRPAGEKSNDATGTLLFFAFGCAMSFKRPTPQRDFAVAKVAVSTRRNLKTGEELKIESIAGSCIQTKWTLPQTLPLAGENQSRCNKALDRDFALSAVA